jgi:hypothetical protein
LAVHLWATLGNNYCVFCFAGYIAFFAPIGFLLVIVSFTSWQRILPWYRQILIAIVILIICAGIGYGTFVEMGKQLADLKALKYYLAVFENYLPKIHYYTGIQIGGTDAGNRRMIPIAAGLSSGIFILISAGIIKLVSRFFQKHSSWSWATGASYLLLFTGICLLPSRVFGNGYHAYDCGGDVISSYEAVGRHLAQVIPPGSSVYWRGDSSAVPLLYIPGVKIYPPQINADFSYNLGGYADKLLKFGFWNDSLAKQWASDADFILVNSDNYKQWLRKLIEVGPFIELQQTPQTVSCRPNSPIRIFHRKSP